MTLAGMLTTSEAARSLNVAESFVVDLIRSGALTGTQQDGGWLVDAAVLVAFKRRRDVERRQGLRELTRMTEEVGGYDRER